VEVAETGVTKTIMCAVVSSEMQAKCDFDA